MDFKGTIRPNKVLVCVYLTNSNTFHIWKGLKLFDGIVNIEADTRIKKFEKDRLALSL